jgi:pyruvate/2-oxoglutarate/acetoin dehydrogenase E1 component
LHAPGLEVLCASNPDDAKGEVPSDSYTVPIGEAAVLRKGKDVTVVSWGAMGHEVIIAREKATAEEVDAELLDLRILLPLDINTLIESVKKTGRLVVGHEAPRTSGYAGELITSRLD